MRGIVGWSLRFRPLVLGIAVAALALGASQIPRTPVEALPEFIPPYVEVQTEALGLSAHEVEQLITVPLEADLLHGVAWLHEIRSRSMPGLSSIVLFFEPGTDVIRARQMVAERLTQAHALPNVSRPPVMLQPLAAESRVLMVALSSSQVPLIDLSVLARWTVKPRLLSVPGVANVAIWGERDRQLQVLMDPVAMRRLGVTPRQVIESTGNSLWVSPLTFLDASTPGTGGFIDTPNQRLGIQHILPITTPADLARVPIEDGKGARLGDVAQVVEDHQPLIGDAVVGANPGLILVVEKFPEADTIAVSDGVEGALAALAPGLTGIQYATVFRPADDIVAAARQVGLAIGLGLLLMAALLALVLGWRTALIAASAAALSLTVAGIALGLLGQTLNAMTFAGLAAGLIIVVDDVVTGAAGLRRRLRDGAAGDGSGPEDGPIPEAILAETTHDRRPLVYAVLITALVLLPVIVLGGAPGAFLPPIGLAFGLTVGASFVVASTVTPALAAILYRRRPGDDGRPRPAPRLRTAYHTLLAAALRRSRVAAATTAIATIAVVAIFATAVGPNLASSLRPDVKGQHLIVRLEAAPGTARAEMDRVADRVQAELAALPGVGGHGVQVGRAITSDRVVNNNVAEVWLTLDQGADRSAALASVGEIVSGYPGLAPTVTTYPTERVGAVLAEPEADLVVRVYGQDRTVLETHAAQIRDAMSNIEGIVSPTIASGPDEPSLQIQVDLPKAERYGIKAGDVRREAAALLSGIQVGSLFENQRVFEVVVWGRPELRNSIDAIRDLLLDTPNGPVRLADVASVAIAPTPTVIDREGVFRILDVAATVQGRDIGAVTRDVRGRLASMSFPLEYRAEVRSPGADRQAGLLRLLALALAAAIGIFLLFQTCLGSWRRASLAFLGLPPALAGGVLAALVVDGGTLSLGAVAGLAAVLVLAVRQSLQLGVAAERRLASEAQGNDLGPILEAATDRLTPVLATAAVASALLAPTILFGDVAGLEVIRPMALVTLGGLLSSVVVGLFVLPAAYIRPRPTPAGSLLPTPQETPDAPAHGPA